jgi:gamma-glutamylcysteine synthetase
MPMPGPQKHTYKKSSRSEHGKRENAGVGLIKFRAQNVNPIKPMGLKRHQTVM